MPLAADIAEVSAGARDLDANRCRHEEAGRLSSRPASAAVSASDGGSSSTSFIAAEVSR